jgi:hypothetical protein
MSKGKMTKWMESNLEDLMQKFIDKNQDEFDEFVYDEWDGYNNQEPPDMEDR